MKLQKAVKSDIHALQSICREAYTQVFADHWTHDGLELYLEQEFGTLRLEQELEDEEYEYYFISEQEEPVGFLKIHYASDPQLSSQENCELEKIYILPRYGGKGLGRKAMTRLLEIVQARSKQLLFLCVIDTNMPAIAFYQKLGFSFHSRTRLEVPNFKEELRGMHRMVLELGAS